MISAYNAFPSLNTPRSGGFSNPAGMMQMFQIMQMVISSMMVQMASQQGGPQGCGCSGTGMMPLGSNPSFGSGGIPQGFPAPGPFLGGAGVQRQLSGSPAGESPRSSRPSSDVNGGQTNSASPTGNIVNVPGGRVDASIAGNVRAMMDAARRDGVSLEIRSSFRSRAEQERLYRAYQNGTGNLAARPGTSNHESGQAIDFKNTPGAWNWLRNNAERFGLRNLPGEPWHYSTTGR